MNPACRRLNRRRILPLFALLPIWTAGRLSAPAQLSAAEPRWPDERTAGPFYIHADFSLEGHANLPGELAQLQRDVSLVLGIQPPQEGIHHFLFQRPETYQAYVQQYFPKAPTRRALYIKGRGPGMVFAFLGDEFEVDLRHETTHALLHSAGLTLPLWLDEGLAEYFEAPAEQRQRAHPHLATTRALLQSGELPRLEELESLTDLSRMGKAEYRDAWAWTHLMLHGPPALGVELRSYLRDLAAERETAPLSRRLRAREPNLSRTLVDHFRP